MTGKEQRILGWAIDDLARGDVPQGVRRLCELVRRPVPELRKRQPLRAERQPRGKAVTQPVGPQTEEPEPDALATPMEQWKRENPTCLIISCHEPADCHHIWSKGLGGPDCDWNRAPLGRNHHRAWHELTPEPDAFLAQFAQRISPAWHQRIAAARARQQAAKRTVRVKNG